MLTDTKETTVGEERRMEKAGHKKHK